MNEPLVAILLLVGSCLFLIAVIGLLRMPDPLCRAHATAKASCLGVLLILLAVAIEVRGGGVPLMLLCTAGFQFFTIPIAAHLVGSLAWRKRIPMHGSPELARLPASAVPPNGTGDSLV